MTKQPLGQLIDKMLVIKDKKAELNAQIKDLNKESGELELSLLERLDEEATTQGRSHTATATVSELVVPTIDDWEAFEEYILENNALYMLEKRPSGAIFRELMGQGEEIPGLKPFTKTSISLRRL